MGATMYHQYQGIGGIRVKVYGLCKPCLYVCTVKTFKPKCFACLQLAILGQGFVKLGQLDAFARCASVGVQLRGLVLGGFDIDDVATIGNNGKTVDFAFGRWDDGYRAPVGKGDAVQFGSTFVLNGKIEGVGLRGAIRK